MRLLPLILYLVPTTGYADDDAAIAESTTSLIDRGWRKIEEGVLTGRAGAWAVEYGDIRIEAPLLFESVTNVDAELEYRTHSSPIW